MYLFVFSKFFTIFMTRLGVLAVWRGMFWSRLHGVFWAMVVAVWFSPKHVWATLVTCCLTLFSESSPSACKYSWRRRL